MGRKTAFFRRVEMLTMSEKAFENLNLVVRDNFWIEVDGVVVLSRWRVDLLKAVAQTGSISAAARRMQIPYRLAWQRIHEMETCLGMSLLTSERGGQGGGGSLLTADADNLIQRYEHFAEGLDEIVQRHFQNAF